MSHKPQKRIAPFFMDGTVGKPSTSGNRKGFPAGQCPLSSESSSIANDNHDTFSLFVGAPQNAAAAAAHARFHIIHGTPALSASLVAVCPSVRPRLRDRPKRRLARSSHEVISKRLRAVSQSVSQSVRAPCAAAAIGNAVAACDMSCSAHLPGAGEQLTGGRLTERAESAGASPRLASPLTPKSAVIS